MQQTCVFRLAKWFVRGFSAWRSGLSAVLSAWRSGLSVVFPPGEVICFVLFFGIHASRLLCNMVGDRKHFERHSCRTRPHPCLRFALQHAATGHANDKQSMMQFGVTMHLMKALTNLIAAAGGHCIHKTQFFLTLPSTTTHNEAMQNKNMKRVSARSNCFNVTERRAIRTNA